MCHVFEDELIVLEVAASDLDQFEEKAKEKGMTVQTYLYECLSLLHDENFGCLNCFQKKVQHFPQ